MEVGRYKDIPAGMSLYLEYYLGIEFANNGSWDSHVQKVIEGKKQNQLHRFLSNRSISKVARRIIIVGFGTSPYFSEVWACNEKFDKVSVE